MTIFLFGVAAWQDLQEGKILNWISLLPGVLGLIFRFSALTIGMGLLFSVLGYLAYRMKYWKEGDWFLLGSLGFAQGYSGLFLVLAFPVIAVLYVLGWKAVGQDEIRMGPAFFFTALLHLLLV